MKLADIEKAQETAEGLAAAVEAARTQHQAALNSQEEELAAREEKLVVQRTQELEQRHKETLDAQALVHAGKVKELEVERDELKG